MLSGKELLNDIYSMVIICIKFDKQKILYILIYYTYTI